MTASQPFFMTNRSRTGRVRGWLPRRTQQGARTTSRPSSLDLKHLETTLRRVPCLRGSCGRNCPSLRQELGETTCVITQTNRVINHLGFRKSIIAKHLKIEQNCFITIYRLIRHPKTWHDLAMRTSYIVLDWKRGKLKAGSSREPLRSR
jgi:hypothetical protein